MMNKEEERNRSVEQRHLRALSLNAGHKAPGVRTRKPRLLLAEDDLYMRTLLANTMRRAGFEVIEACDGAELVTRLGNLLQDSVDDRMVDLVISDIRMPWATGLSVLESLRRNDWEIPFILITAFGDEATHLEAKRLGASEVFDKPFDLHELRDSALRFAGGA